MSLEFYSLTIFSIRAMKVVSLPQIETTKQLKTVLSKKIMKMNNCKKIMTTPDL